jgi:hypothetical protein
MNLSIGVLIVIGLCALPFVLAFTAYVVAKYTQMGKLAGTRSFLTFNRTSKEKTHGED